MGYFDRINEILDAGCPVMMIHTHEFERAYAGLKSWCKEADAVLYKWNCVEGMVEVSLSFDSVMTVDERVTDLSQVLVEAERRVDNSEMEVFVVEGIVDYIHRPDIKALLRKLTVDLPKTGSRKRVIMLSQIAEIPTELAYIVPLVPLPLPDFAELNKILEAQLRQQNVTVAVELRKAIIEAAEGLPMEAASLAFKLAGLRTSFGDEAPAIVREARQLFIEGSH
jgi:hypothetical protein